MGCQWILLLAPFSCAMDLQGSQWDTACPVVTHDLYPACPPSWSSPVIAAPWYSSENSRNIHFWAKGTAFTIYVQTKKGKISLVSRFEHQKYYKYFSFSINTFLFFFLFCFSINTFQFLKEIWETTVVQLYNCHWETGGCYRSQKKIGG